MVKPISAKPSEPAAVVNKGAIQLEIESDFAPGESMTNGIRPDLIKADKDNIATITLADCLACNGCVTTAETMLIQQHSIDKFEELLEGVDQAPIVVSVSQQSLYSL